MLLNLLKITSPHFRKKRFLLFQKLFLSSGKKLKILDVGGTQEFWEKTGCDLKNCNIIILNLFGIKTTIPNFESIVGDARNMKEFRDKEFNVVFSNSVMEHVGNFEDQKKMAREIQRVGKHYFVQTPNYYFPFELHFLFPFFQYLPLKIKIFLIRHFTLGWRSKTPDYNKALEMVNSIRLLKKEELMVLFPKCKIYEEKFIGLTKSFVIYK